MTFPKRRWITAALLALAALGVFVSLSMGSSRGSPAAPPYVTYFLIDGLSQTIFEQERAAGRLPELDRLVKEGTFIENGIAAFPSMTAYGFFPLLTGHDASRSGVLGLRWFDRGRAAGAFRQYVGRTNVRMNEDFRPEPRWLFEHFPGLHSFSLNSYANRGVVRSIKTGWGFSMAKYREQNALIRFLSGVPGLGGLFPGWERAEAQGLQHALDDLADRPKIQWITFASPDARQHVYGTDETYPALIRNVDALIGKYRAESERLGLEKDRIYVVVSDHGVAEAHRNVDLRKVFEEVGLSAWRGEATSLRSSALEEPLSTFKDEAAVIAVNGNMMNHVYLRHPDAQGDAAWRTRPPADIVERYPVGGGRPPVNLVERLRHADGVELVVTRPIDGVVRVYGRDGIGRISGAENALVYTYEGKDPLGLGVEPGAVRTGREWLGETYATHFPDSVVRLHRLMTSQEVGELVVTALPGVDLAADYELIVGNYRGGHGGLRADQLRVPYVLSGPGVPRGKRIVAARAEDIGATVFGLLGLPLGNDAEGINLLEEPSSAAIPGSAP